MIPTYEDILNAIAAAFQVSTDVAERWLMIHVGQNIIAAAEDSDASAKDRLRAEPDA